MTTGSVRAPTVSQLESVASDLGMTFSAEDLELHRATLMSAFDSYNELDRMNDELPAVVYPRTPGRRPPPEENKHGAWYVKSEIRGAPDGLLSGKRIVLKDNICLAGVPMMNGSSSLEGYVPDIDATVVARILDAGGTIVGKAVCEYLCFSSDSNSAATGPVHHPLRMGYSAGGSSSGSACLVALGEADMALGADQGGSIRMPSATCGVYGMKPTHGLVPYTGVMSLENTLDHIGPISSTVADNALLLEVLAGPDGLDHRQYGQGAQDYRGALGEGLSGLKIGVLDEGFGFPHSLPGVDNCVRAAANTLRQMGAVVKDVSVPMHLQAGPIWLPIAAEGSIVQMMHGNGFGFGWQGLYVNSLLERHSAWRQHADSFSETLKSTMMLGQYMVKQYRGKYYAKAQNIVRRLRAAYDQAFSECDLLLMPTMPIVSTPMATAGETVAEMIDRAEKVSSNAIAFNCTHHPAFSAPCGMVNDMPVGMMLVGRMFDERSIYRAAAQFEAKVDWKRQFFSS